MSLRKLREQKLMKAKTGANEALFQELEQDGSLLRCKHMPGEDTYECVIHSRGHRSWVPWKLVNRWLYDKKVKLTNGVNGVVYGIVLD